MTLALLWFKAQTVAGSVQGEAAFRAGRRNFQRIGGEQPEDDEPQDDEPQGGSSPPSPHKRRNDKLKAYDSMHINRNHTNQSAALVDRITCSKCLNWKRFHGGNRSYPAPTIRQCASHAGCSIRQKLTRVSDEDWVSRNDKLHAGGQLLSRKGKGIGEKFSRGGERRARQRLQAERGAHRVQPTRTTATGPSQTMPSMRACPPWSGSRRSTRYRSNQVHLTSRHTASCVSGRAAGGASHRRPWRRSPGGLGQAAGAAPLWRGCSGPGRRDGPEEGRPHGEIGFTSKKTLTALKYAIRTFRFLVVRTNGTSLLHAGGRVFCDLGITVEKRNNNGAQAFVHSSVLILCMCCRSSCRAVHGALLAS